MKLRLKFNFISEFLKFQLSIQKRQIQTSTTAKSFLLNKLQKTSLTQSYTKIKYFNQYRCLLETTKVKIIGCFDDALDYIEKLLKEKYDIERNISDAESKDLENKHEQTKRLNYLNEVYVYFKNMSKIINDIKDLEEMAKDKNQNDESRTGGSHIF